MAAFNALDADLVDATDYAAGQHGMAYAPPRGFMKRAAVVGGAIALGTLTFVIVSRGALPIDTSAPIGSHVDQLAIASGLGVDEIRISGHRYTLDKDIFAALDLERPTSLLRYSSDAARRRLEALSWVKHATVTRVLPDTVEVKIVERVPMAVWLHGDSATLVDIEGRELARVPPSTLPALPRIAGAGAPEAVGGYLAAIATAPEIEQRVKVAARVGQRRWTLELDNGSRVLLPAEGEPGALARLLRQKNTTGVLARPMVVDLRLEERMAVVPRTDQTAPQVGALKGPAVKSASAL